MFNFITKITEFNNKRTLFEKPIFILSPPRSGSTLLFEIMANFSEIVHFGHESDFIWWECFPYETMSEPSDYVGKPHVNQKNIALFREKTFRALVNGNCINGSYRGKRFLDKTIANCFHLEFIEHAFPSAQFIFLVRNPCDNISSMIEGWPFINRFGKSQLTPELNMQQSRTIAHWTYPAPHGWQHQVNRPLEEICAWSWQQHIDHVLNFFTTSRGSYHLVKYEELISNPRDVIAEIAQKLGLNLTDKVLNYAENPKLSATTVSPPLKGKWRDLHYNEIVAVMPMIEKTANTLGYDNLLVTN